MGAIDPSNVHPVLDHGVDQVGSFGGVGRECHHDASDATRRLRAEQVGCIRGEYEVALGDTHRVVVVDHVTASGEPIERCEYGVDGGHDMRFGAAE